MENTSIHTNPPADAREGWELPQRAAAVNVAGSIGWFSYVLLMYYYMYLSCSIHVLF